MPSRPRLVIGSQPGPAVAMKELMEQQQFAPMGVFRPDHFLAEAGTPALAVG